MSSPASAPGVVMEAHAHGGFRTVLTHGPSGSVVHTEAPKDNGGTGMSFSPTDLVGAALVSCVLTTMQLMAQREGMPFTGVGARARVEKHMSPSPRRIAELTLIVEMPAGLSEVHRKRLEEIARGCPVARSLHPDVKLPMEFRYAASPA